MGVSSFHASENPIARLKGRDLGANLKNFARDLRTGGKGTWRFALVLSGDDKACCEANTGRAYANPHLIGCRGWRGYVLQY